MTTRLKPIFLTSLCSFPKPNHSVFPSLIQNLNFSSNQNPRNGNTKQSFHPNEQILMSLSKKCSTTKHLKQIHTHILKSGYDQTLFLIAKLIVFCAVSDHGIMDYAVSIFETIKNPDGFLWNTMIRGFSKNNQPIQAFEYFNRMKGNGETPDNFTFSFLGKVCVSVSLVEQMHCEIIKLGLESHVFVGNTLIHMYGKVGVIKTAYKLFDEMPKPNLVAWNTIIDCYVRCGKYSEALELFLNMLGRSIEPDEATLVVTISACSKLCALDFGKWVHSCIDHTHLVNLISVSNSLIDMYAKCGALQEAYKVFNHTKTKNVVIWNTMIHGFANHGHVNEALTLFSKMLEEKVEKPDDVTFLGVLTACSHGGMVEEGRRYFHIMKTDYNIEPSVKHYGCLVDMLGRAGFVEEGYGLLIRMPVKCNAVVWRSLLAASRIHGEVKLGEMIREQLMELEPDHSGDYVLLANMYADAKNWSEVVKVRKSMLDRGVEKPAPGNSLVGVHQEPLTDKVLE